MVRIVVPCALVAAIGLAPAASAQRAPAQPAGRPPPTATATASADVAAASDLDAWLGRLTGADEGARTSAVAAIATGQVGSVPAIARRIAEIRRTASRDAMALALAAARKHGPTAAAGEKEPEDAPPRGPKQPAAADPDRWDWFGRVMAAPRPGEAGWRDLASVLGMSRLLVRAGTTAAAREVVAVEGAFADVLRVDVQRQIARLGDRAVPALIEARRGPDKALRTWAARQLDAMGKAIPGEAVQVADHQVLADVLRAHGQTKDPEAVRVVVSFTSSERGIVRDAAREAVRAYGQDALWQIREAYENLVGQKAGGDWSWERAASELFAAQDRARLAEVYDLMEEGLAAHRARQLDKMAAAFDRVLARAPSFERRAEMVPGYFEHALAVEADDRDRALSILRRAQRIDPRGAHARAVEAEIAFLEAEDLAARGLPDPAAYRRVLDVDPSHARARAALERIARETEGRAGALWRWTAAGAIALIAAVALIFLGTRRPQATG